MHNFIKDLLKGQEVEWKTLGEVAKITDGFALNAKNIEGEGAYSIVKIGNISNGTITLSNSYIKSLPEKLKSTQIIHGGEILV